MKMIRRTRKNGRRRLRSVEVEAPRCRACGQPFSPERPRFYRELLCRPCARVQKGERNRVLARVFYRGVYRRGERNAECAAMKMISGRERLLRDRRIVRYARCVARGVPIEYEPPDLS